MVSLHRIVVHEVKKEVQSLEVELDLSQTIGDSTDELSAHLVSSIHSTYSNTPSLKNTHFAADSDNPFTTHLKTYLEAENDDNFYTFSVQAIQHLRDLIANERLASGGYYCFADYEVDGRRYITVILLRRKDSINFVKERGVFKAAGNQSLTFDKIAMGFRLNLNVYNSEEDSRNYISLITTQKDTLSSYFKRLVLVADLISSDQNTSALVRLVRALPIPVGENEEPVYTSRDQFNKACYEYVEQCHQKKVNLLDMAKYFYGEDEQRKILDQAEQLEITIDTEFKRVTKIWKRVVAIKVSVPGIELKVDYDKLNPREVDVQNDTVIIRSPDLVAQIRQQQDE